MELHEEYGLTREQMAELRIFILKLPMRKFERKTETGWEEVQMKDLHDGDHVYVTYPPDDYEYADHVIHYKVEGEPHIDEEYRWTAAFEPIEVIKWTGGKKPRIVGMDEAPCRHCGKPTVNMWKCDECHESQQKSLEATEEERVGM